MQSLLGKLYAILTTGSEVAPASTDNFFQWASPGYPVTSKFFEFAYLGTTGETIDQNELKQAVLQKIAMIKEAREAAGQEQISLNAEELFAEVKDSLQKKAQQRRSNAAANFASLVDFIPDVSGNAQQTEKTKYDEGTLSDAYSYALQMAQVKYTELTDKEKTILEQIEALLGEKVETIEEEPKKETENAGDDELAKLMAMIGGDDSSSSDSSDSGPKTRVKKSPYMEAYLRYQDAYDAAVLEYNNGYLEGTLGDLLQRNAWKRYESMARKKVNTAMAEWKISGHKDMIEKLQAQKSAIEGRDFSIMLENYKQLFDHYKVADGDMEYLTTTVSPSDFMQSGGWTRFTFSNKEIEKYSGREFHEHSRTIKTKTGSWFHKTTTTNTEEEKSCDIANYLHDKSFELSFDFCQVKIVRPWFKESFINSHFWRFHPEKVSTLDNKDKLSDGGDPPKGMMPAYATSILLIRNLNLKFTDKTDASTLTEEYSKNSAHYSGGLRLGWFNIHAGASYTNNDADYEGEWTNNYTCTKQGISVPGLQIIGYNCHVLGLCPNPDPDIKESEWI